MLCQNHYKEIDRARSLSSDREMRAEPSKRRLEQGAVLLLVRVGRQDSDSIEKKRCFPRIGSRQNQFSREPRQSRSNRRRLVQLLPLSCSRSRFVLLFVLRQGLVENILGCG